MSEYSINNMAVGKNPSSFKRSQTYLDNFDKLSNDKNNIKVINNFISDQECDDILNQIKDIEPINSVDNLWTKKRVFRSSQVPSILKYSSIIKDKIEELYSINVEPNGSPTVTQWFESCKMSTHVDDLGVGSFHIASIIYLNDDYVGGQISFPTHNVSIKPQKADLLIFPGNLHYAHEVEEVLKGNRFTIPTWYSFV